MDECAPPPGRYLHRQQAVRVVEDLVELDGLDDEVVVENLRARFLAGTPYTGAGSVMVALNPCRNLVEVYDREMQSKYMRYNRTDLPAHVYGVSAASYWALCEGRGCQQIVLAGESGSGKTLTAGVVLEHLIAAAELSRNRNAFALQTWSPLLAESDFGGVRGVHEEEGRLRRLAVWHRTILEGFGNARTSLSENSSRFFMHTKVFFSSDVSRVLGVESNTLLLETSRLSSRRRGERAFHVFDQILNADEEVKKRVRLGDKTAADFRLTAEPHEPQRGQAPAGVGFAWRSESDRGSCSSQDAGAEVKSGTRESIFGSRGTLKDTIDAMAATGVAGTEVDSVLRGVSAVLHLHQIEFKDVGGEEIHRNFDAVQVGDEAPFEAAREMLGCKKHDLLNALLTRRLAAGGGVDSPPSVSRDTTSTGRQGRGEMLVVPLNRKEAGRARDKLAQEVYLRLFRWLVKRVNASTCLPTPGERQDAVFVGLLDTCGVENTEQNGFEQLCRNYAAEKLRGNFLQGVVGTSSGYEGHRGQNNRMWVRGTFALLEESRELLAMFEGPLGLIRLAEAELLCPEGSNRSFVGKLLAETPRKQLEDGGDMFTKENSGCVEGSGGRHGDAGSVRSAWPVYADPKSDGRSDPSFHIKHFVGPVQYSAINILERNDSGIGKNLLDLLDEACTNELVGVGSRSDRYRDERRANNNTNSSTKGGVDHRRQILRQRTVDESVLSQHRRQFTRLLDEIGTTEVRALG
ncbi:unnamed protein product [Laminaria digitata]